MVTASKTPSRARGDAQADEPMSERRTLRDYAIILRERFWIALPLALLVSIGLGYMKARQVPLYQSTATMRFEKPAVVVGRGPNVTDESVRGFVDLNTYLQELGSASMRERVINSLTPEEARILQRPYLQDLQPGQEPPRREPPWANSTLATCVTVTSFGFPSSTGIQKPPPSSPIATSTSSWITSSIVAVTPWPA